MSFVLGFGSTEIQVEDDVVNALIAARPTTHEALHNVLRPWNTKAKENDALPRGEAPERYTSIYFYEDMLHFHHVNRNHPFSPDGWALLQTEKHFHLFPEDSPHA